MRRNPSASRRAASLTFCLLLLGCADLEISHQGVIDFEHYSSVSVRVSASGTSHSDTNYLIRELRRHSAFTVVVPADEPASTFLDVNLWVSEFRDDGLWKAWATYELLDSRGLLLSGEEPGSSSRLHVARQRSLDRIVVRFLPSYRY